MRFMAGFGGISYRVAELQRSARRDATKTGKSVLAASGSGEARLLSEVAA
jgi:hypothetical protein